MNAVRERASLDERTVQKVARGEVSPKRKKGRRVQTHRSSAVRYTRLDARVLAALKAMRVDYHCVQVVSPTEVVVWNSPAPWPKP